MIYALREKPLACFLRSDASIVIFSWQKTELVNLSLKIVAADVFILKRNRAIWSRDIYLHNCELRKELKTASKKVLE